MRATGQICGRTNFSKIVFPFFTLIWAKHIESQARTHADNRDQKSRTEKRTLCTQICTVDRCVDMRGKAQVLGQRADRQADAQTDASKLQSDYDCLQATKGDYDILSL
jgi:hypothetical protein